MVALKIWEKLLVVVAMTLLIGGSVTIFFGGIFFGFAGFFSLIGVTYDSMGSLFLFVLYCFLIGIVSDLIEKIILYFIVKTNLHKQEKFLWILLVKMGLTWMVIHIVNDLMTSVNLSTLAEVLTALLIVSVDIVFDDEKVWNK